MAAAYRIEDLLKACVAAAEAHERGEHAPRWPVRLIWEAPQTARDELNLPTEPEALMFLASLSPQDFVPGPLDIELVADAFKGMNVRIDTYTFKTAKTQAYIAFFKNPKNSKWNIKSLKENIVHREGAEVPALKHNPFQALLGKKTP